ncbi:MAG TPA: cell division protein FtsB [Chromatiales bacterium]|nr:cell division protein FtsB [Chromatiales bacterium]
MRWLIAILVALILILQYRLWVGDGSLAEVYHLKRQIEEQRATLEKLRERNKALQAEVEDLREGLEAVEERARSELGMIKEGEVFYQVIQEPAKRDDKHH